MVYGGFPALWAASGQFIQWLGFSPEAEIPQTVAFVCIGSLVNNFISLPWSAYYTFKVEQKHGFNKQTPGFFLKDKLKKFVVSQLIASPVVAGLVYIIKVSVIDLKFCHLFLINAISSPDDEIRLLKSILFYYFLCPIIFIIECSN